MHHYTQLLKNLHTKSPTEWNRKSKVSQVAAVEATFPVGKGEVV